VHHTATTCNTLQHTATHLYHTATICNILQHTATQLCVLRDSCIHASTLISTHHDSQALEIARFVLKKTCGCWALSQKRADTDFSRAYTSYVYISQKCLKVCKQNLWGNDLQSPQIARLDVFWKSPAVVGLFCKREPIQILRKCIYHMYLFTVCIASCV